MSGKEFLKEHLALKPEKNGVIVGTITSEATMGYLKENHGVTEAQVKAVVAAEKGLTQDLLTLGTELLADNPKAEAVRITAAQTSQKRHRAEVIRAKTTRNPQTGEETTKPAFRIKQSVKTFVDKTLVAELTKKLK